MNKDVSPGLKGLFEIKFDHPFEVKLFPNSNYFEPTTGIAIGVEKSRVTGTEWLIVKHGNMVRIDGLDSWCYWDNGLIYVPECDVEGWKPGQREKIG